MILETDGYFDQTMLVSLLKTSPRPLGRWILVAKTREMDVNRFIEENKRRRQDLKDRNIDPSLYNQKIERYPLIRDEEYMIPFVFDLP